MAILTDLLGRYVGEDLLITFTIYQAGVVPLTAQDITGWTIEWFLEPFGNTIASQVSLSIPASLTQPTQGKGTVTVTRAQTVGLNPGNYQYHLDRTDSGSYGILAAGRMPLGYA